MLLYHHPLDFAGMREREREIIEGRRTEGTRLADDLEIWWNIACLCVQGGPKVRTQKILALSGTYC